MTDRITAADIRAHMRKVYCDPEWALLFEVLNATGARATRSADAIAMSLWPSRGLHLHGFEIKVSRNDWQNERKDPAKAETIAAYCDFWTLITGPGVVREAAEVPQAWGWYEFDGNKFIYHRTPSATEARDCDRSFLAALLRRAARADESVLEIEIRKRDKEREERFEERLKMMVEARTRRGTEVLKEVEEFESAAGVKLSDWRTWTHDAATFGRAAKALIETGVMDPYSGIYRMSENLIEAAQKMRTAMSDNGFGPPPALKKKARS